MLIRVLAAALVLAATAPGGCGPTTSQACEIRFGGIEIAGGLVREVVTPTCALRPQRHLLHAQLEYRAVGEYSPIGREAVSRTIPDTTGYPATVSGPCLKGWYRTKVRVSGLGPVDDLNPEPRPFDRMVTGQARSVTAEECRA